MQNHLGLEGVSVTDAENAVPFGRDGFVCGPRGDHRDAAGLRQARGDERPICHNLSNQGSHFVVVDQTSDHNGRLLRQRLGILGNQFYGVSQSASCLVDFLDG